MLLPLPTQYRPILKIIIIVVIFILTIIIIIIVVIIILIITITIIMILSKPGASAAQRLYFHTENEPHFVSA